MTGNAQQLAVSGVRLSSMYWPNRSSHNVMINYITLR
jgi:hypothetical protein